MTADKKKRPAGRLRARLMLAMIIAVMCFGFTGCSYNIDGLCKVSSGAGELLVNIYTAPSSMCDSMLKSVIDTTFVDEIGSSLLMGNGSTNGSLGGTTLDFGTFWGAIQSAFNALKPAGIALCTTFFIISLIGLASRDNVNLEHFIKEAIKYMIALAVMTNLILIMNYLVGIADGVTGSVQEGLSATKFDYGNGMTEEKLKNQTFAILMGKSTFGTVMSIDGSGNAMSNGQVMYPAGYTCAAIFGKENILEGISAAQSATGWTGSGINTASGSSRSQMINFGSFAIGTGSEANHPSILKFGMLGGMGSWYSCAGFMIVLWLATFIAKVAAYFAMAQRILDVGWRIAFAPIGCANMFDGAGSNVPGIRYLKGVFASLISGALLIVILKIGCFFSNSLLASCVTDSYSSTAMIMCIAVRLAMVGAAIGVGNKVKEVLG